MNTISIYDVRTQKSVNMLLDDDQNIVYTFGDARWHSLGQAVPIKPAPVDLRRDLKKTFSQDAIAKTPLYLLVLTKIKLDEHRDFYEDLKGRLIRVGYMMLSTGITPREIESEDVQKQVSKEWALVQATQNIDNVIVRYVLTRRMSQLEDLVAIFKRRLSNQEDRDFLSNIFRDQRTAEMGYDCQGSRLQPSLIMGYDGDTARGYKQANPYTTRGVALERGLPYLGSGRDPVHDAGLSAVEGLPEYICCGQGLKSPGCLIDTYSTDNTQPVLYQIGLPNYARTIHTQLTSGVTRTNVLVDLVESWKTSYIRGTAYIVREPYDRWHDQIQTLLSETARPVSRALYAVYTNPQQTLAPFDALGVFELNRLVTLYSLVNEYNRFQCVDPTPGSMEGWMTFFDTELFRRQSVIDARGFGIRIQPRTYTAPFQKEAPRYVFDQQTMPFIRVFTVEMLRGIRRPPLAIATIPEIPVGADDQEWERWLRQVVQVLTAQEQTKEIQRIIDMAQLSVVAARQVQEARSILIRRFPDIGPLLRGAGARLDNLPGGLAVTANQLLIAANQDNLEDIVGNAVIEGDELEQSAIALRDHSRRSISDLLRTPYDTSLVLTSMREDVLGIMQEIQDLRDIDFAPYGVQNMTEVEAIYAQLQTWEETGDIRPEERKRGTPKKKPRRKKKGTPKRRAQSKQRAARLNVERTARQQRLEAERLEQEEAARRQAELQRELTDETAARDAVERRLATGLQVDPRTDQTLLNYNAAIVALSGNAPIYVDEIERAARDVVEEYIGLLDAEAAAKMFVEEVKDVERWTNQANLARTHIGAVEEYRQQILLIADVAADADEDTILDVVTRVAYPTTIKDLPTEDDAQQYIQWTKDAIKAKAEAAERKDSSEDLRDTIATQLQQARGVIDSVNDDIQSWQAVAATITDSPFQNPEGPPGQFELTKDRREKLETSALVQTDQQNQAIMVMSEIRQTAKRNVQTTFKTLNIQVGAWKEFSELDDAQFNRLDSEIDALVEVNQKVQARVEEFSKMASVQEVLASVPGFQGGFYIGNRWALQAVESFTPSGERMMYGDRQDLTSWDIYNYITRDRGSFSAVTSILLMLSQFLSDSIRDDLYSNKGKSTLDTALGTAIGALRGAQLLMNKFLELQYPMNALDAVFLVYRDVLKFNSNQKLRVEELNYGFDPIILEEEDDPGADQPDFGYTGITDALPYDKMIFDNRDAIDATNARLLQYKQESDDRDAKILRLGTVVPAEDDEVPFLDKLPVDDESKERQLREIMAARQQKCEGDLTLSKTPLRAKYSPMIERFTTKIDTRPVTSTQASLLKRIADLQFILTPAVETAITIRAMANLASGLPKPLQIINGKLVETDMSPFRGFAEWKTMQVVIGKNDRDYMAFLGFLETDAVNVATEMDLISLARRINEEGVPEQIYNTLRPLEDYALTLQNIAIRSLKRTETTFIAACKGLIRMRTDQIIRYDRWAASQSQDPSTDIGAEDMWNTQYLEFLERCRTTFFSLGDKESNLWDGDVFNYATLNANCIRPLASLLSGVPIDDFPDKINVPYKATKITETRRFNAVQATALFGIEDDSTMASLASNIILLQSAGGSRYIVVDWAGVVGVKPKKTTVSTLFLGIDKLNADTRRTFLGNLGNLWGTFITAIIAVTRQNVAKSDTVAKLKLVSDKFNRASNAIKEAIGDDPTWKTTLSAKWKRGQGNIPKKVEAHLEMDAIMAEVTPVGIELLPEELVRRANIQRMPRVADSLENIDQKQFYASFGVKGALESFDYATINVKLLEPVSEAYSSVELALGRRKAESLMQEGMTDVQRDEQIGRMKEDDLRRMGASLLIKGLGGEKVLLGMGILVERYTAKDERMLVISSGVTTELISAAYFYIGNTTLDEQKALFDRWGALARALAAILQKVAPDDATLARLAQPWRKSESVLSAIASWLVHDDLPELGDEDETSDWESWA
jgi:hypothetical protein